MLNILIGSTIVTILCLIFTNYDEQDSSRIQRVIPYIGVFSMFAMLSSAVLLVLK